MKIKIITIAVLALVLLCAIAPMAATAAPQEPKRITERVYLGTFENSAWGLSTVSVGVITIDTTTGQYLLTCHGVGEGDHVLGMVAAGDSAASYITEVSANDHGNIKATGTFKQYELTFITQKLQAGKSFEIDNNVL